MGELTRLTPQMTRASAMAPTTTPTIASVAGLSSLFIFSSIGVKLQVVLK